MTSVSGSSSENSRLFAKIVGPERNFDIINKKTEIGGRAAEFYMIDGFVKDDIMEKLLESFIALKPKELPDSPEGFMDMVPYIEVTPRETLEDAAKDMLMGMVCMFLDGYRTCFVIDCRTYPARGVSEPWKNRVLRAQGTALWRR